MPIIFINISLYTEYCNNNLYLACSILGISMLNMESMKNTPDIRRELGVRMRQLRKERGLTQSDLEDRSGLNEKYYSEIERGLRNVTLSNLQKIATGLEITLAELFRFPSDLPLSEDAEELIALVTRLLQKGNRRKIRQVLIILKELVGQ